MIAESVFTGLKVLDASTFIAGPAAAAVLSDFRATSSRSSHRERATPSGG